MNRREKLVFGFVFIGALALWAVAYALTEEQILNSWYDAANTALRVNIVAGG